MAAEAPNRVPGSAPSAGAPKKNKKVTTAVNGSANGTTASKPAQAEKMTETAEAKAAASAIEIIESKDGTNGAHALTPTEKFIGKRIKAVTKKLQRVAQYEDLPGQQLNEDQKRAIAGKGALQAVFKELQELGKGLEQAMKEEKSEAEAQAQEAALRAEKSGQADGDATLLLLQQILRLFTLMHTPQITPTFAPTGPSFLDSVTGQEAAAVGKLYQDLVEQPLYSGAEEGQQTTEGSVQESLKRVAEASGEEILPGITYANVKELIGKLQNPAAASDQQQPPTADVEIAKSAPRPEFTESSAEKAREAIEIAPELVTADAATHSAAAASANGISFLQSSEVGSTEAPVPATSAPHGGPVEAAAGLEPEGGAVDSAPLLQGEDSKAGALGGQGTILGQDATSTGPQATTIRTGRVDWSADIDDNDDLGDPMDAFPDQKGANGHAVQNGHEVAVAPLQSRASDEPTTPPPVTEAATADIKPASTTPTQPKQHRERPSKQQQQQQQSVPPPKKGPIVDEDGFTVQTSKRTLHQQQQQQQQQASQSRGRGRGRGRGGRGGGGAGAEGGRGGREGKRQNVGQGREQGKGVKNYYDRAFVGKREGIRMQPALEAVKEHESDLSDWWRPGSHGVSQGASVRTDDAAVEWQGEDDSWGPGT